MYIVHAHVQVSALPTISCDGAIVDERLFAFPYSVLHNFTQNTLQLGGGGGLQLGIREPNINVLERIWMTL